MTLTLHKKLNVGKHLMVCNYRNHKTLVIFALWQEKNITPMMLTLEKLS